MKGARALKRAEAKLMIKAARTTRERLLVQVGLCFGLRISESLTLRLMDLKAEYISIKSKKHSNNVSFPVPAEIRKLAGKLEREYRAAGYAVDSRTPAFLGQKSRRGGQVRAITRQAASILIQDIKAAVKLAGNVTYHSFRKAFATLIYERTGKDVIQTMKYTRHRNLNNLIYYINVSQQLDLVSGINW